MANSNVQNVRFLRNGSLYSTREEAKTALTAKKASFTAEQDGSIILARYQEGGDPIKTLVGFIYFKNNVSEITIFDIDDAGADVDQKINELRTEIEKQLGTGITSANTATAQLAALSGDPANDTSATTSVEGAKRYAEDLIGTLDASDTAVEGSYVSQVSEADGKISVSRVALPDASSVADDNKVVTDVTQSKGAITATASNITGVKLAGYEEAAATGDVATTDTLGQALGKLQKTIHEMDKTASAEDGKVVTTISETDGVVSETKANVKDLQLGGYTKTNDTGDIASADTINVALSKLENKAAAITIGNADGSINVTTGVNGTDIAVNIKSGEHVLAKDGNAGVYTNIAISAVTGTELSNLGTNVKEAYKLVGTDSTKLGEYIKIYKDSSLVNFYLGHVDDILTDEDSTTHESPTSAVTDGTGDTALVYIMQLANGNYKLAAVNVESFLQEAEFDSGVTVDSGTHVVHGVVDPTSENFLTVGADGFKLAGVQDAINAAVNALDATGGTQTIATDKHVAVEVIETDGKITTVTVVEDNIADADDLTQEISDRQTADTELSNRLGTGVTTANTATAQLTALSGDSNSVSGDTSIEGAKRYADGVLAAAVDGLDAEVTGGTTAGTATSNHVQVIVSEANGKLTAVTVTETNIADADDLANEIAARKAVDGVNGDTYTADTNANYISGASSLYGADQALDTALKALSDATVNQVKVNNVALAETNNAVNVQISGATAAATASNGEAIVVTTDNSTGAITLGLASIDCGTY